MKSRHPKVRVRVLFKIAPDSLSISRTQGIFTCMQLETKPFHEVDF